MARKSAIQKLWEQVDHLKVLINRNPHVPLKEVRRAVDSIEEIVQVIRKKQLQERCKVLLIEKNP